MTRGQNLLTDVQNFRRKVQRTLLRISFKASLRCVARTLGHSGKNFDEADEDTVTGAATSPRAKIARAMLLGSRLFNKLSLPIICASTAQSQRLVRMRHVNRPRTNSSFARSKRAQEIDHCGAITNIVLCMGGGNAHANGNRRCGERFEEILVGGVIADSQNEVIVA
jgi:hypothetical protein